jgi:hypothetical protein
MSVANVSATATMPADVLETRAADQRRRIHDSVLELRGKLEDKLDVRKKAAEYVWPASGTAVLIGLVVGWGFAGMFSSPRA